MNEPLMDLWEKTAEENGLKYDGCIRYEMYGSTMDTIFTPFEVLKKTL